MNVATLLFLAHIVARALVLVWGRAYARVARKGTVEHAHLDCFLRRAHAKGAIGARGESFIETMKKLVMAVARIATFDGFCPVEKGDRAPVWTLVDAVRAVLCTPALILNDLS